MTPNEIDNAEILASLAALQAASWTTIGELRRVHPFLFDGDAMGPYDCNGDVAAETASTLYLALRLLHHVVVEYRAALAQPARQRQDLNEDDIPFN